MFLLRQEHFGLFCIAIEHLQIETLAEQLLPAIEFQKLINKSRQTAIGNFFKNRKRKLTCFPTFGEPLPNHP